jgi:hypothetical protein
MNDRSGDTGGTDDAGAGHESMRARLERLERERQQRERELREGGGEAAGEGYADAAVFGTSGEAGDQLLLSDENERLPWLESDDEYEDHAVDTTRIVVVAAIGLAGVLALVALAWFLSRDTPDAALLAEGSTIEAPDAPFRERPADPGGADVDGTGDLSFEVGEGQTRETRMASAPDPLPVIVPSATPTANVAPSIDREQDDAPAQDAATQGGYGVQVGAYNTRAAAQTGWGVLLRQHPALSGVNNRIVQAVVDGNTVYRLQAVAGTEDAAEALCRALKATGGDCRVMP